jgi:thioredoxin 1
MESVVDVSAANWDQEVAKSTILTAVYFWHDQCPWCLRFAPVVDEVSEEYRGKVKFVKLNILADVTNQEIANNYGVMSTPTLMFFCSGRPTGQTVGMMSKDDLGKALIDILGRYRTCLAQSTQLRPSYIV